MLNNYLVVISYFKTLGFFGKVPNLQEMKKAALASVLQGAKVEINDDVPFSLCVTLSGRKVIEINRLDNYVSAIMYQKIASYPIEKSMTILSLTRDHDSIEVSVSENKVVNRIFTGTNRLQVSYEREDASYDIYGRLIGQRFIPCPSKTATVSNDFLESDICSCVERIVMMGDLEAQKLRYTFTGENN